MVDLQLSCQNCELNESVFSVHLEKLVFLCHHNNNFFVHSPNRIRCIHWRPVKEKNSKEVEVKTW